MEQTQENYTKAFNAGYLMREHDPEMLDHILKGQRGDNSEYIKAMTAGKNQYEKDKQLEQLKQPQPPSKDRER